MRNLRSFFDIVFDTREISDDQLRQFAEDHLQRLTAKDDPDHAQMIADTTSAFNAYFGAIDDSATHAAVQKSLTKAMNNALAEFQQRVSRREGVIRDLWGKDSPEYLEFFPKGLTEYANMTLANAEKTMQRFIDACTAHKAQLGQPYIDLFTGLLAAFTSARKAQLGKKGDLADSKTTTTDSRSALEKQLMKNLLTLAIEFLGNPDAGMAFFDQSIIYTANPTAPAPTPAPTPAAATGK